MSLRETPDDMSGSQHEWLFPLSTSNYREAKGADYVASFPQVQTGGIDLGPRADINGPVGQG
jgi:hypothetical protein